jgi:hypothetical protein
MKTSSCKSQTAAGRRITQLHDGPRDRNAVRPQPLAEISEDAIEEALLSRPVYEPVQHPAPLPRPVLVAMGRSIPTAGTPLLRGADDAAVLSDVV